MSDEEYYSGQFRKSAGVLAAFFVGLLACTFITYAFNRCKGGEVVVERDTIRDTITVTEPVLIYDTVIRFVKKSPIILHDTTVVLKNDTNLYITPDTQVVIPISQKIYEDSTYKAWVSGYMPSLDSLRVYRTTITIKTTEYKKQRWSWGVQGGAGIDVITMKPSIYLGIGGTYTF